MKFTINLPDYHHTDRTSCVMCGSTEVTDHGLIHQHGHGFTLTAWCGSRDCQDDRRISGPKGLFGNDLLPVEELDKEQLTRTIAESLAMSYGSHINAPKGGGDWRAAESLLGTLMAMGVINPATRKEDES